MWATVLGFLQIIKFFIDLYHEVDKKKADEQAIIGKEVVDAFAETDKKNRASKLSAAVVGINRLRK